jgi:hypothetical protein
MILDKVRICKYTYTNHNISALNLNYYKFGSNFDTTEFSSGKINIEAEAIYSMIQRQHLA